MKYGSSNFTLLTVDGYDLLSAKPQQFAERREAVLERTDGLGDTVEAQTPTGLLKITITQGGAFFDDRQNGMHTAFAHAIPGATTTRTLMYSFTGGKTVTTITGVYTQSYAVIAQQGRLTKANVTYQVNGVPSDGGRMVQPTDVHTASWTGAVVDLGAGSSGATVTQTVIAIQDGSIAGIVEHSDDGVAGWTTVATFTPMAGAPNVQTQTVGAVKRYVRYKGTIGTPGPLPSVRVAVVITPT